MRLEDILGHSSALINPKLAAMQEKPRAPKPAPVVKTDPVFDYDTYGGGCDDFSAPHHRS